MLVEKKGSPGYDPKMYMAKKHIQIIHSIFFYRIPAYNVMTQFSYVGPASRMMIFPLQFNSTQLVLPPYFTVFKPGTGILPRTPQNFTFIIILISPNNLYPFLNLLFIFFLSKQKWIWRVLSPFSLSHRTRLPEAILQFPEMNMYVRFP